MERVGDRIGVVGSGIMGAGIAEVAARSGCDVVVREVTRELAEAGRDRIAASLERAVTRGKLAPPTGTRRWTGSAPRRRSTTWPTATW